MDAEIAALETRVNQSMMDAMEEIFKSVGRPTTLVFHQCAEAVLKKNLNFAETQTETHKLCAGPVQELEERTHEHLQRQQQRMQNCHVEAQTVIESKGKAIESMSEDELKRLYVGVVRPCVEKQISEGLPAMVKAIKAGASAASLDTSAASSKKGWFR